MVSLFTGTNTSLMRDNKIHAKKKQNRNYFINNELKKNSHIVY